MDKDGILWELQALTKELARQVTNEHRCRYYGEARGMIKTLQILRLIDIAEADTLKLKAWKAHDQAINQCLEAGEPIDAHVLTRHKFQVRMHPQASEEK